MNIEHERHEIHIHTYANNTKSVEEKNNIWNLYLYLSNWNLRLLRYVVCVIDNDNDTIFLVWQ